VKIKFSPSNFLGRDSKIHGRCVIKIIEVEIVLIPIRKSLEIISYKGKIRKD